MLYPTRAKRADPIATAFALGRAIAARLFSSSDLTAANSPRKGHTRERSNH
jgi:hypothetical protein